MNYFVKSHGLGNDYIVIDEKKINFKLNKRAVKRICDRNYGIGSDGLLVLVSSSKADFGLRIFNPDGSEAEKSGIGLRIFSKFLYDNRYTNKKVFSIENLNYLYPNGHRITHQMKWFKGSRNRCLRSDIAA